ncbi:MAG TPA: hypothetical protein VF421_08400 [Niabella sp.]
MKKNQGNTVFYYAIRYIMVWMLLLAGVIYSNGQEISNRLQGYFKATSDTALYSYFTFDGNGKVDIMGLGDGYYFQKGDTVIVYPDKSIFKFLLKNDQLYGASIWVDDGEWILVKDTIVENKRTDPEAAERIARLMHQYYEVKTLGETGLLGDLSDTLSLRMQSLCDSGLSKACLDYAGLKIIEQMGGIEALLGNEAVKIKKEASPEVLAVIEKAIQAGDPEGYAVLGGYYATLQNTEKAKEVLEKGGELGCRRCVWAAVSLAMQEETEKEVIREKRCLRKK